MPLLPRTIVLLPALLLSCTDPPKREPTSGAATVDTTPPVESARPDSVPIPYGPPAVIAKMNPNYRYPGGEVAFSDTIDQQIARAALPPGPEARERCEFIRYATNDRLDEDECCNDWTPWLTEFCALTEFSHLGEASDTTDGRYPRPVPLPNAAGRLLFLAESTEFGPIVLLEFRGSRYRARVLGWHHVSGIGGVRHWLYRSAGSELLVLENTNGGVGQSGGGAVTWLQVYDLRRDKWLFSALVGQTEEQHGYTDDDGREVPSRYFEARSPYAVRDQGRRIVLGRYRRSSRPVFERVDGATVRPLPAGTYRLVAGRYRRGGQ